MTGQLLSDHLYISPEIKRITSSVIDISWYWEYSYYISTYYYLSHDSCDVSNMNEKFGIHIFSGLNIDLCVITSTPPRLKKTKECSPTLLLQLKKKVLVKKRSSHLFKAN